MKHTSFINLSERLSSHGGDFKNIHEASRFVWETSYRYPYKRELPEFYDCEFHDDQTSTTWSTDSSGHTKKDYRKEALETFISRWKQKEGEST